MKVAGDIVVDDSNLQSTAVDACRKCAELPLSIATAAKVYRVEFQSSTEQ